ncbi:hypothetical protein BsWGS_19264 [Bradybaena similaris]
MYKTTPAEAQKYNTRPMGHSYSGTIMIARNEIVKTFNRPDEYSHNYSCKIDYSHKHKYLVQVVQSNYNLIQFIQSSHRYSACNYHTHHLSNMLNHFQVECSLLFETWGSVTRNCFTV